VKGGVVRMAVVTSAQPTHPPVTKEPTILRHLVHLWKARSTHGARLQPPPPPPKSELELRRQAEACAAGRPLDAADGQVSILLDQPVRTSSERILRWEQLTDARHPRNGYYDGRRRDPEHAHDATDEIEYVVEVAHSQPTMTMSVRTRTLSDDSFHTQLLIGERMSATLSCWILPEGDTESMTVVSQLDPDSGKSEVVYRRLMSEGVGDVAHNVTESGNASATLELLEQTASHYGVSTDTLLQELDHVPNVSNVFRYCMPPDLSAEGASPTGTCSLAG